jgi:hypothetical protein
LTALAAMIICDGRMSAGPHAGARQRPEGETECLMISSIRSYFWVRKTPISDRRDRDPDKELNLMTFVQGRKSALIAMMVVAAMLLLVAIADRASAASHTLIDYTATDFGDLSDFSLNGVTAGLNAPGTEVLRLTNDYGQSGSAFLTTPIAIGGDASFSTAFAFQITDSVSGGADGIVFAVQTDSAAAGGGGGGIGYDGITPSVGIEFDTWHNGELGDPNDNHVGINLNGSVTSIATAIPPTPLENGLVKYAWVDYDGSTDTLEVRLSESPSRPPTALLTHTVDLAGVIGADDAFIGFTSGTGGAAADHTIRSWSFVNEFSEMGDQVVPPVLPPSPPPPPDPEPELPTDASDCKKGGWEEYGIFKNQGDCVSFVATDGKNPPALGDPEGGE